MLAWKTLALSIGKEINKLPVIFDHVKVKEATILPKEGNFGRCKIVAT